MSTMREIGEYVLRDISIVRMLDSDAFIISAGKVHDVIEGHIVEVLIPPNTYTKVGNVSEVYEHYSICRKIDNIKVCYGDLVKVVVST